MTTSDTRRKVLVVDDDIDLLLQMKVQLENAGYDVTTAESRTEAEELLGTYRPDIAILDLMMENVDDGFILSHAIKKLDDSIPVILATAVTRETGLEFDAATSEDRAWLKADVVIDKPVRFEQLKREMDRLLRG